jgi:hypothetical protein
VTAQRPGAGPAAERLRGAADRAQRAADELRTARQDLVAAEAMLRDAAARQAFPMAVRTVEAGAPTAAEVRTRLAGSCAGFCPAQQRLGEALDEYGALVEGRAPTARAEAPITAAAHRTAATTAAQEAGRLLDTGRSPPRRRRWTRWSPRPQRSRP